MKPVFGRCSLLLAILGLAACQQPTEPEAPAGPSDEMSASSVDPPGPPPSSRFIVLLRQGSDPAAVARDHGIEPEYVYGTVLNGFAGGVAEAARAGLLRDSRVLRVAHDEPLSLEATLLSEDADVQMAPPWGLDRVDQRTSALDGRYVFTHSGAGVSIYVVDSGILHSHSEFEGRAVFGFDALRPRNTKHPKRGEDCHGHGTHVAGTVGGRTYGVAKNARLVSVRVFDCNGFGWTSGVIAGIDWVAEHGSKPGVANMSFGGWKYEPLDDAVRGLVASGVSAVVSAGNSNGTACDYSPARVAEAVTLGATDDTDTRASFSNWGDCVDWFAPGVSILSAWADDDEATRTVSGTSMAAPHVAGAAALFLESSPSASPAQVREALFARATKDVVRSAQSPRPHLVYTLADESGSDDGSADESSCVPRGKSGKCK